MKEWLRKKYQEFGYQAVSRVICRVIRFRRAGRPQLFLPVLISAGESGKVLSLSPHPDDDVFAIGGTLAGHGHGGGEVHSVVLTSGERGTVDASTDTSLLDVRRREAEKAGAILQFKTLEFWEQPDGGLKPDPPLVQRLADRIIQLQPDWIYAPFPVDYHGDHLATGQLLVQACESTRYTGKIRCYECIIPLIPNIISDISAYAHLKLQAVECFESQNAVSDYGYTIVNGLNRLRTHGLMKGKGHAEALFETDHSFLNTLIRILNGG